MSIGVVLARIAHPDPQTPEVKYEGIEKYLGWQPSRHDEVQDNNEDK